MIRKLLLILLILGTSLPAAAQSDCGNGLPCGSLPWSIPQFGSLRSPTPLSDALQNVPPTPTPSPVPTSTLIVPELPIDEIANFMQTVEAAVNTEPDFLETPVADSLMQQVEEQSDTFFSYAKGFGNASFGPMSPIITFLLFVFAITLLSFTIRLVLAFLSILIGVFRRIAEVIIIIVEAVMRAIMSAARALFGG